MRTPFRTLLAFALFSLSAVQAQTAVNRTIDDALGDSETGVKPLFSPAAAWHAGECAQCAIRPDPAQAFQGTWTEATYRAPDTLNIQLSFRGTAIYIFFILADYRQSGITTITECAFSLDGGAPVPYHFESEAEGSNMLHGVMVFSRSDLENEDHTLEITTGGDDERYVNFDYAIYTTEEEGEDDEATTGGRQSTTTRNATGTSTRASDSSTDAPPATGSANSEDSSSSLDSDDSEAADESGGADHALVGSALVGVAAVALAGILVL